MNKSLSTILREEIMVMGSGRTDTGVHATMQVVHFDTNSTLEPDQIVYKLNGLLPPDISANSIRKVTSEANTRFDAISRQYHYKIHQKKNPFLKGFSYQFPKTVDLDLMNEAAALLLKWEDFECFSRVKTEVNNFNCDIVEAVWQKGNDQLLFCVRANRFLRGMVRAMVGTLLDVGEHRVSMSDFQSILESRDRKKASRSAPAEGLYLNDIVYPDHIFTD
jgi:tRNA pseudouridine38-40 synthase